MLSTYELFSIMEPKIFDIFEAPYYFEFFTFTNKVKEILDKDTFFTSKYVVR